jgi:hypothetical protein
MPIFVTRSCRIGESIMERPATIALLLILVPASLSLRPVGAQQVIDTAFRVSIDQPAFPLGTGPLVLVDQAHFNAVDSIRYRPAMDLLRRDGYVVEPLKGPLTNSTLARARVLVSFLYGTSARAGINLLRQANPGVTKVGAFTDAEVAAVRSWVQRGGSLLLAVDHQPAPLAAEALAEAFGVGFLNGIAFIEPSARLIFRRADGTLVEHSITRGIEQVATFGGSAFKLAGEGEALLVLGPDVRMYFANDSSEKPVGGWLQGAAFALGRGRVVVFAEAGMFTAQFSGPGNPMGMNAPIARQNPQLLLNVMHWLSGVP